MKFRDPFTTLHADRTSTDARTVDVQAKYYNMCRTVLHEVQNRGCPSNFDMPYWTDHISCLTSISSNIANDSLYFRAIINFESLLFHISINSCYFTCFVRFITHLLPLVLQLNVWIPKLTNYNLMWCPMFYYQFSIVTWRPLQG